VVTELASSSVLVAMGTSCLQRNLIDCSFSVFLLTGHHLKKVGAMSDFQTFAKIEYF